MIPVSRIRDHLEIPDDLDDIKLTDILDASISMIEHDCGSIIKKRNFKHFFNGFSCGISILNTPLMSITSIEYKDEQGVWQTVPTSDYVIMGRIFSESGSENSGTDYYLNPKIELQNGASWPTDLIDEKNNVRVIYVAGFERADLPKSVERAALLVCGSLYENREELGAVKLYKMPAYQMAINPIARNPRVG